MKPLDLLNTYWNYDAFRSSQEEIIDSVIAKKDVLAILPTSGGKSICYQIPGLLLDGICIVVSPLIALMQDQVESLNQRGIKAIALTSKLTHDETIVAFDNLQFGNVKFLYLSPEKLQSSFIQEKIKQLHVGLIAVDEAHCISEWGHDFRPSYLKIAILRDIHTKSHIIALTATATQKVIDDIIEHLYLDTCVLYKRTFERENLAYQVFKTEDPFYKLEQILKKIRQPIIVYVNTRGKSKAVSEYINQKGYKSTYYNGGLTSNEKERSYSDWTTEKKPIMVATNAFGMGIDKGNVAAVIHLDLPNSIENYVQEAGRAGRNGKKAFSVLLYNKNSILDFNKRLVQNTISVDELKEIYKLLNQHLKIANSQFSDERHSFDLQAFNAKYNLDSIKAYNAIKLMEKEGLLIYDQNYHKKSQLQFCADSKTVLQYSDKNHVLKPVIQLLLRSYGGIFDNLTTINEDVLAKKLSIDKAAVIKQLMLLQKDNIVVYTSQSTKSYLQFLVMREDDRTINRIAKNVTQRNKLKKEKAHAVIRYIQDESQCRNRQLLAYFDELSKENCGICEVCISKKGATISLKEIVDKITEIFKDNATWSAKEIVSFVGEKEELTIKALQLLLEKDIVTLNSENKYEKRA